MLTAPPINWYTVTWVCGGLVVEVVEEGGGDVVEVVSGRAAEGAAVVLVTPGDDVVGGVATEPLAVVVETVSDTVVDCRSAVVDGGVEAAAVTCGADGLVGTSSADSA